MSEYTMIRDRQGVPYKAEIAKFISIPGFASFRFALIEHEDSGTFTLTELSTGLAMGAGRSEAKALAGARREIKTHGRKATKKRIAQKLAEYRPLPEVSA